jgi:hypothetical protein
MNTAPTTLPTTRPNTATQKFSPNSVVASAPVTTVRMMMFDPNQTVKRSRALPCLSFGGMGWIVLSSILGLSVAIVMISPNCYLVR